MARKEDLIETVHYRTDESNELIVYRDDTWEKVAVLLARGWNFNLDALDGLIDPEQIRRRAAEILIRWATCHLN